MGLTPAGSASLGSVQTVGGPGGGGLRRGPSPPAGPFPQPAGGPPGRPASEVPGLQDTADSAAAAAARVMGGSDLGAMLSFIRAHKLATNRPPLAAQSSVGSSQGGPGAGPGSSGPGSLQRTSSSASSSAASTIKWVQPSGPRKPGEGVENEEQGLVSVDRSHVTGAIVLRVTLLAAGFVIGPSGMSVRDIMRHTGCDIKSWTEQANATRGLRRPCRVFVLEGDENNMIQGLRIIIAALDRYKELCEGRCSGQTVSRVQRVEGVEFSYQPPPRNIVPFAAALKGHVQRPPRGGGGGGGGVHPPTGAFGAAMDPQLAAAVAAQSALLMPGYALGPYGAYSPYTSAAAMGPYAMMAPPSPGTQAAAAVFAAAAGMYGGGGGGLGAGPGGGGGGMGVGAGDAGGLGGDMSLDPAFMHALGAGYGAPAAMGVWPMAQGPSSPGRGPGPGGLGMQEPGGLLGMGGPMETGSPPGASQPGMGYTPGMLGLGYMPAMDAFAPFFGGGDGPSSAGPGPAHEQAAMALPPPPPPAPPAGPPSGSGGGPEAGAGGRGEVGEPAPQAPQQGPAEGGARPGGEEGAGAPAAAAAPAEGVPAGSAPAPMAPAPPPPPPPAPQPYGTYGYYTMPDPYAAAGPDMQHMGMGMGMGGDAGGGGGYMEAPGPAGGGLPPSPPFHGVPLAGAPPMMAWWPTGPPSPGHGPATAVFYPASPYSHHMAAMGPHPGYALHAGEPARGPGRGPRTPMKASRPPLAPASPSKPLNPLAPPYQSPRASGELPAAGSNGSPERSQPEAQAAAAGEGEAGGAGGPAEPREGEAGEPPRALSAQLPPPVPLMGKTPKRPAGGPRAGGPSAAGTPAQGPLHPQLVMQGMPMGYGQMGPPMAYAGYSSAFHTPAPMLGPGPPMGSLSAAGPGGSMVSPQDPLVSPSRFLARPSNFAQRGVSGGARAGSGAGPRAPRRAPPLPGGPAGPGAAPAAAAPPMEAPAPGGAAPAAGAGGAKGPGAPPAGARPSAVANLQSAFERMVAPSAPVPAAALAPGAVAGPQAQGVGPSSGPQAAIDALTPLGREDSGTPPPQGARDAQADTPPPAAPAGPQPVHQEAGAGAGTMARAASAHAGALPIPTPVATGGPSSAGGGPSGTTSPTAASASTQGSQPVQGNRPSPGLLSQQLQQQSRSREAPGTGTGAGTGTGVSAGRPAGMSYAARVAAAEASR